MVALRVSELDWREGGVLAQPTPTESVLRRCAIAACTSRPCSLRWRLALSPERDEPRAASSSLSCGSFISANAKRHVTPRRHCTRSKRGLVGPEILTRII